MSNNYIYRLKIHYLRFLILFSIVLVIMTACFDQPDCLVTATNQVQIVLKKRTRHSKDTAVVFAAINVSGSDSSYYNNDAAVSTLFLPVDPGHDSTIFLFHHGGAITDTIVVGYKAQSKVISTECGAYTYFQELRILKSSLADDQFKILNPSLLFDPTTQKYATNLQVFY